MIRCMVKGDPEPIVSWYYNGQMLSRKSCLSSQTIKQLLLMTTRASKPRTNFLSMHKAITCNSYTTWHNPQKNIRSTYSYPSKRTSLNFFFVNYLFLPTIEPAKTMHTVITPPHNTISHKTYTHQCTHTRTTTHTDHYTHTLQTKNYLIFISSRQSTRFCFGENCKSISSQFASDI